MLDTLEREYRTVEDIHEKLKIYTDEEIQKILIDRLEQLDENKQNFLRVFFFVLVLLDRIVDLRF